MNNKYKRILIRASVELSQARGQAKHNVNRGEHTLQVNKKFYQGSTTMQLVCKVLRVYGMMCIYMTPVNK